MNHLSRHSTYFQIQNGTISILLTDNVESVDITNFKRGALSSLQFDHSLVPGERIQRKQVQFVQLYIHHL
jgi:hypothetical protein